MKHFYSLYVIIFLLWIPDVVLAQPELVDSAPNVILIMADDLGYGELGSYGQEVIQTPHLDRMAEEGMRFTNFYAGSTVCAPSRNSIMTGRHTGNTYIRGNFPLHHLDGVEDMPLPENRKTIANYMQKAGYHTAMIGKWGLGSRPNSIHGFDFTFAYLSQLEAHDYYPPYLWENEKKYDLSGNENDEQHTYSHSIMMDKTLEYIENRKDGQPFFLYLPYTIPHGPFNPPEDIPYTDEEWPQQQKNIAAMITMLDRGIGRILQLLHEKGIGENTVVFFTSDNGPTGTANRYFESNGPFRGIKRDLYEGGIRVPMIAWWPGTIQSGQISDHASGAWDFLPTIVELSGSDPPSDIDGISFLPELLGENQPQHDFLYWEFYDYNWSWDSESEDSRPRNWLESQAIRYDNWKAIKNNIFEDEKAEFELYHLERDPAEQHNVASEHPEVIRIIEDYVSGCCATSLYFPY